MVLVVDVPSVGGGRGCSCEVKNGFGVVGGKGNAEVEVVSKD